MMTIRYRPEAATAELLAWLRPRVKYDAEGRLGTWLVEGAPLPAELANVARIVCPERTDWSGVVMQCYQHGNATTECHSDVGATGFCFIYSLGATRTFRIHRVEGCKTTAGCGDYDLDAIRIEAVHGTAILMDESFQAGWHHQVAADVGVTEERLSLVFRTRPGGHRNGGG